ncbi:hypothetical protein CFOL_v3_33763 [Cephalotus follicularis]|uniref:Exo_endo_phos domain-containing protein n=1 Tax=Cephalotus follicularis TaxID=3775 RepID=A0A1Q3DCZ9_CEPFO|nr:hypothetical protein CFOL_v3_33763 [Cephalotus follicularis]
MGDFNVTRYEAEHSSSRIITKAMNEFNKAIISAEQEDLKGSALMYTWSNMRCDTYAHFHPPGISDHSPITIHLRNRQQYRGRSFKFINSWVNNKSFLQVVSQEWEKGYAGSPLIVVHKKLKSLKGHLKVFSTRPDTIGAGLRARLLLVQQAIYVGVGGPNALDQERQLRVEVRNAARDEESLLKQKSRIQWLKEGDSNTAFFHRAVMVRQSKNHLVRIKDEQGNWLVDEDIARVGVNHFTNIMGMIDKCAGWNYNLYGYDKQIAEEYKATLGCPVTR